MHQKLDLPAKCKNTNRMVGKYLAEFITIPNDEVLKETIRFREWLGPALVKLFYSDDGLYPLGSGGLIKYKERFFIVTNEHVVRGIIREKRMVDIVILYTDKNNSSFSAEIIGENEDRDLDIAAFEIRAYSAQQMVNQYFMDEALIESNIDNFLKLSNIVFLHGFPYENTEIDHDKKVIETTSFV